MEEKLVYGALTVYRERGAYLRRLEQFEKAKTSYDEAYLNFPDDVRLLIGRSQVSTDAVQPIQAFNDADLALKLQPDNMIARNMQSRALYTLSEFEKSLVMNYRGLRQRRQPPYFMEGINQGQETVQDCIGANSGNVMHDFLPFIKHIDDPCDIHAVQKIDHVSRIPCQLKKEKMTQLEAKKKLTLSRVLAMKYLGPMAQDKFFLEELSENRIIQSANAKGSKKLKGLINEAQHSLNNRQEMLHSQRPYYSIKLAEKSESKHQTKIKKPALQKEIEIGDMIAMKQLKQIKKSLNDNRIMDLTKQAQRLQLFLDKKVPKTLPEKDYYIDRLYRFVGEGYLQQYRISYRLGEANNRRRIAFLLGLPVKRPTSFDSVYSKYPHTFVDVKLETERIIATLEMCENTTQRCFLMYELAKLLVKQKNFALCKYYCNHCQTEAAKQNDPVWWLNACMVHISSDMHEGSVNDLKEKADQARKWTEQLVCHSLEIQVFLDKCVEMSHEIDIPDARKLVMQREKQILNVMEEPERTNTEVLFKRIATVPAGRRFAVCFLEKDGKVYKAPERKKLKQIGLTIVPGQTKSLRAPPKSKTLGFQIFRD